VRPALEGYFAAVLGEASGDELPRLADDLRAIEHLVDGSEPLRGALADTALAPAVRRAVIDDLLSSRVSDLARRAADFAVASVAAPDALGALGWLALRATEAADGTPTELARVGHSAARERVGGFATHLFETLPTDRLEEVEDELFRFARTVEATPALRSALSDAAAPLDARLAIVTDLLGAKVQAATLRLVSFVVVGGRPRDFVGTLDWLVETTASARGWRVARVTAGAAVDDAERTQLRDALERLTGAPVELQVSVDPELLSGVLVRVGDLQVDATTRGRLNRLREHLVPGGRDDGAFGAHHPDNAEGAS
jgi:F-type H+-transporting ATPase subunit delta